MWLGVGGRGGCQGVRGVGGGLGFRVSDGLRVSNKALGRNPFRQ